MVAYRHVYHMMMIIMIIMIMILNMCVYIYRERDIVSVDTLHTPLTWE